MGTNVRSAGIYVRISQDRVGAGLGVARQEADCRALCKRLGWRVAEVYTDNDTSAYKGKVRPGYRRMIDALKDGTIDAVVAWHTDRLHRSPRELEDFITVVEATGAEVSTVTAGMIDLSTATGRMTARIVGAVDRQESEHKSERLRRKHVELAEAGKVPGGGQRPFGFDVDRITVRLNEAALIREAAARALAGEGVRTLAADFNRRGVPSVTGVPWSATTIKRLLTSGRIAGQREHHGKTFDAVWPAIIDRADLLRLRSILNDPARRLSDTTARRYVLSGMVQCGRCGATMTSRPINNRGYRYRRYACVTDRNDGCNRCGIGARPLEALVLAAVLERLDSRSFLRAQNGRAKGPDLTMQTVVRLERRMAELAEMFAAGEIGREEWTTARASLDRQLAEARGALADRVRTSAATAYIGRSIDLRDVWDDMNIDQQRAVIRALVDHVTIAGTTRSNNVFDPGRVTVVWRD